MPDFLHYQITQKNPRWGEAITEGFRARVARPEAGAVLARGYTHIIAGLQFGALEVLQAVRAAGEPYIFADRAYFGGGYHSGRMRLTRNAYQYNGVPRSRDGMRARVFGVRLEPWRLRGDFVMVVPPSPQVEDLFGIAWERDWMPRIRAASDLPIVVSQKSDRDVSPIAERLKACHAVVTWTSNVGVDAICAGVPVVCSPASAAWPMAQDINDVEILLPYARRNMDRSEWLASLAWAQFTVNEIAGGFAQDVVMERACATT